MEWISDSGYNGPQRVIYDASVPYGGRITSQERFNIDESHRQALLADGDPFAVIDQHSRTTLWQAVHPSTGRWPLYRRFTLPPGISTEEIEPIDYVILPYLAIPEQP
jgi:hypothetical protein